MGVETKVEMDGEAMGGTGEVEGDGDLEAGFVPTLLARPPVPPTLPLFPDVDQVLVLVDAGSNEAP